MTTATVAETTIPVAAAAPEANMQKVHSDSLWILANYGVTAISGMLFWVVAARLLPPGDLGTETAVLSIIMAAATMAAIGPGNGLLALLPAAGRAAPLLLRLGLSSVAITAAVYGLAAGVLVDVFLPQVGIPGYALIPLIAITTVVWALFVFKDPSFGGMNHMRWAVVVNGSANLVKLGLLVVFGVAIGVSIQPVLASAIIPAILAVLVWLVLLVPRMVRGKRHMETGIEVPVSIREAKQWMHAKRRPYLGFVFRDGMASSLNLGVGMSLTFLVTATAGAQAGAVFALCYQVSSVLDLVVVGATGSLIMNNAAGHANAAKIAFRMWIKAFAAVAALAAIIMLASPFILGVLGEFYVKNGGIEVLGLLLVGSVLRTAFEVWCALLRADHKTGVLLAQNSITAAILLPAAIILSLTLGAAGCAMAILGVTLVQATLGFYGIIKRGKQEITGA